MPKKSRLRIATLSNNGEKLVLNRLFVYGTLAPGQPNEHLLARIGGQWVPGSVKGTLHPEGWGATMGYPAVVLDSQANAVSGFVFSSENLAQHWAELDEFEGEAYEREIAQITLESGETTEAYIYSLKVQGSPIC